MKRIFSWIGGGDDSAVAEHELSTPRFTADQVAEVTSFFPIGSRVHYHPEYQEDTRLETVILAYGLDDLWVFSAHDLEPSRLGLPLTVRTGPRTRDFSVLDDFTLVVPHATRAEIDLAGPRAAGAEPRPKAVNDFRRGNTITLSHRVSDGRIAKLDTEVARSTVLNNGYYAGHRVCILRPDLATLVYLDQRKLHRIETRIPAELSLGPDESTVPCHVVDFSERYLRVTVPDDLPVFPRCVVRIELPGMNRAFVLKCRPHRREGGDTILGILAVLKDRRFQPLEMIDELDLKTSLLHHPSTREVLVGGN